MKKISPKEDFGVNVLKRLSVIFCVLFIHKNATMQDG